MKSYLERDFLYLCSAYSKVYRIPKPVTEYRFFPGRRWRFDFAWPDKKVAVELEGGLWIQGRHNRAKGMMNDMEKYNAANRLGWKVLRYGPHNMTSALQDLREILNENPTSKKVSKTQL